MSDEACDKSRKTMTSNDRKLLTEISAIHERALFAVSCAREEDPPVPDSRSRDEKQLELHLRKHLLVGITGFRLFESRPTMLVALLGAIFSDMAQNRGFNGLFLDYSFIIYSTTVGFLVVLCVGDGGPNTL